ncbi:hypothetical protein QN277_011705 [Acacia crassicarpa]|uniref:Agglutinin domain-containing protein n=1 Tax=Acacia crassicarpa TaxID=499986 RepID=A0AAE1MZX6_9FABA|nr:hypothetical protein QN277_011705 [Acacia crassicarpa]
MSLPRFVVRIKSNYNNKYLRYIDEDEEVKGFLQFSGEEVESPYAKFEMEMAKSRNGLVHIRCCYNNKYWVRWSQHHWWIVAGADEPEEDQSKWSCTLFKPIYVDADAKAVRFWHVQLGHYACLWRIGAPFGSCLFAGSENPDQGSCDVCTIIDWESLSIMPKLVAFKGNMPLPSFVVLPRFMVLKSNYNNKYLRFIQEDVQVHGFLQFSGKEVVSQYAKFEVEMAKRGNGLVHIRCCYNNKYWVRWSQNHWWIVAGADEPEEDQSKWSCTLFKPIYVDDDAKAVRFSHVQLGHYACLWRIGAPVGSYLFAGSIHPDQDLCDVCTIIDWESLLIMPKHVAFKGDNDRYLSACWIEGHQYLQFASNDIGEPTVGNEIFTTHDGSIRIKSDYFGKFWRCSHNWILADSDALLQEMDFTSQKNVHFLKSEVKNKGGGILRDIFKGRCCQILLCRSHRHPPKTDVKSDLWSSDDTTNNNSDTLFWPIKVDNNVVALRNLGNNNFCKRVTTEGKTNCLNAGVSTISRQARIEVEELVLSRKIDKVNFRLLDARIYDQKVLTVATQESINRTKEPNNTELKLSYTEIKSSTWNSSVSLKLGVNTSIQTGVPFIAEGKIDIAAELNGVYQWGDTKTESTALETLYKVTVPPMTKVIVSMLATRGSCDVPFSYTQRDTLTNGKQVTYQMDDGIYTGINSFNFKYETKQETL